MTTDAININALNPAIIILKTILKIILPPQETNYRNSS